MNYCNTPACLAIDVYPTSTAGKWCATFAMLMGVLVIAFPVSVFSDLWSHELKRVEGFESSPNEAGVDTPPPKVNNSRETDGSSPMKNRAERRYQATDSNVAMMDKQDLRAIASCLSNIRESERQLRAILNKYNAEDSLL
jgi:hypothetical protein